MTNVCALSAPENTLNEIVDIAMNHFFLNGPFEECLTNCTNEKLSCVIAKILSQITEGNDAAALAHLFFATYNVDKNEWLLWFAKNWNDVTPIDVLLLARADVNFTDGQTAPLIAAVCRPENSIVVRRLLMEPSVDVDLRPRNNSMTALQEAVAVNNNSATIMLLRAGAVVDGHVPGAGSGSMTPLVIAISSRAMQSFPRIRSWKLVPFLLAAGADPNQCIPLSTQTVLEWVIAQRYNDLLIQLLDAEARCDSKQELYKSIPAETVRIARLEMSSARRAF